MEIEQGRQGELVSLRVGFGPEIQLRHDVAPAEKLAAEIRNGLDLGGSISLCAIGLLPFACSTMLTHKATKARILFSFNVD